MASPMRKKRAWSTREDDAESKETAAFEATVAAAKDTAAKSGAFLSSAKSDLTDHQRWLRAQSAAVERDRQRHERWLQRQQEQRDALAKKERTRRRRQLMWQRAMTALREAIASAVLFVRSLVALAFGTIGAGFKYLGASIALGFAYLGQQLAFAARWIGAKLGMAASQAGKGLSAGSSILASKAGQLSNAAGRSLGAGLSAAGARGSALAGVTGRSASSGASHFAAKASALGAAGARGVSSGLRWGRERAAVLAPAAYARVAEAGRRAQEKLARTRGKPADDAAPQDVLVTPPPSASVHVIEVYGPHKQGVELFGRAANDPWTPEMAQQRRAAEVYGPFYEGFWVDGVSPNEPRTEAAGGGAIAARVETESALSSWLDGAGGRAATAGAQARFMAGRAWAGAENIAKRAQYWVQSQDWAQKLARERGFELSQMMIVAGALLLVCGGLLIGGGLLMRAGARPATVADIAAEETFSGITWTFDEPNLPLPERAVFTLSGTPESFRINGLSVTGVNNSDQPLTGLQGVFKPDVQRPDLKLALQVDKPKTPEGEGEPQAMAVLSENSVPAQGTFRLVFPFPPEAMSGEDGITVEEFFDSYGGLLLKLRYEIDGTEKSVIQYLAPDMLKAQLDEVSAQAGDG